MEEKKVREFLARGLAAQAAVDTVAASSRDVQYTRTLVAVLERDVPGGYETRVDFEDPGLLLVGLHAIATSIFACLPCLAKVFGNAIDVNGKEVRRG